MAEIQPPNPSAPSPPSAAANSASVDNNRWIGPLAALAAFVATTLAVGVVHTAASWLFPIIAGLGVGLVAYYAIAFMRTLRAENPSAPDIKAAYATVQDLMARAGDAPNVNTALFILDESKASFERVYNGSDSVESKANALLSIVAGASSALGIFGLSKSGTAIIASPILDAALICVILALACLLYVLRSKGYEHPTTEAYISPAMIEKDHRAGLALYIAETYHDSARELEHVTAMEPLAMFIAYISTAVAAALVLLNVATALPGGTPGSTTSPCPCATPTISPTTKATPTPRPTLKPPPKP